MIAILINGISRRRDSVLREAERTFSSSTTYGLFESQYAGHLHRIAAEVVKKGYTQIICVGGDGTLNEVVNGMISAFEYANRQLGDPIETRYDWAGLSRIKLALYPAGTGNDFARTIQAKPNLKHIVQLMEQNTHKMIDIGYCRFTCPDLSTEDERFCINIADVGMGGEVSYRLSKDSTLRRISPKLLYQREIIRAFFKYEKKPVRCFNDQFEWEGLATAIVTANGKYFGGGMGVAPQADCTSGKIGVTVIGDISLFDYITRLPALVRCRKAQHAEISYHSFDKINVHSLAENMPVDMDGEFVGYTPFSMQKLRQKIAIFC